MNNQDRSHLQALNQIPLWVFKSVFIIFLLVLIGVLKDILK